MRGLRLWERKLVCRVPYPRESVLTLTTLGYLMWRATFHNARPSQWISFPCNLRENTSSSSMSPLIDRPYAQEYATKFEVCLCLPAWFETCLTRLPLRSEVDDINLGLQHFYGDFNVVHARLISSGVSVGWFSVPGRHENRSG